MYTPRTPPLIYIQKYARRRVFYNTYQQIITEYRPKELGQEIDYPKAREAFHKALIKLKCNGYSNSSRAPTTLATSACATCRSLPRPSRFSTD